MLQRSRPDWDISSAEKRAAWEKGDKARFYPYGKTRTQVLAEQKSVDAGPSAEPNFQETFGVQLVAAVGGLRGGNAPEDDETIIVLQRLPGITERA